MLVMLYVHVLLTCCGWHSKTHYLQQYSGTHYGLTQTDKLIKRIIIMVKFSVLFL